MSLLDRFKLDQLWKRSQHGLASTSPTKEPHGESIPSYTPVPRHHIWFESNLIKANPSDSPLATVIPYRGTGAIRLINDVTGPALRTWVTVKDINNPLFDVNNRLDDWISSAFGNAYHPRFWVGRPGDTKSVPLSSVAGGQEYTFDHMSGVLQFSGTTIPKDLDVYGLWIEGYRYVGKKGIPGLLPGDVGTVFTLSWTSLPGSLAPGKSVDFTLDTGPRFILQDLIVDQPNIQVENYPTSSRDTKNPYTFVSADGHLSDDGTYTADGNIYYGPRFIFLMNTENPSSIQTYWRVKNVDLSVTRPVNIQVSVLRLV